MLITAQRLSWFCRWFSWYCAVKLRQQFAGVWVSNLAKLQAVVAEYPILLISNHVSYWDALVACYFSERILRTQTYGWMDGHNLAKLAMFRALGAFGVERQQPNEVNQAVAYAAGLLIKCRQLLWFFPQGQLSSLRSPPWFFGKGSVLLAKAAQPQLKVIPTALCYQFGPEIKPRLYLHFGEPITCHTLADHESALIQTLATQDRLIHGSEEQFQVFLAAKRRLGTNYGWGAYLLSQGIHFWLKSFSKLP